MSVPVTRGVALLRRNREVLALGFLPFVAAAAFVLLARHATPDYAQSSARFMLVLLGLISLGAGLISSSNAVFGNPKRVAVSGQLVIGEAAVDFDGRRLAQRRSLRAGFLIPETSSSLLRLERRWPRAAIDLRVSDEEEARALLRALGFDASQSMVELELASRVRAEPISVVVSWMVWCFGIVGALAVPAALISSTRGPWTVPLVGLGTLVLAVWAVLVSRTTFVLVGTDGLLIRWFWSTRFVPHREIREVQAYGSSYGQGVQLELSSRRALRLPIRRRYTDALTSQEVDRVGHRILQTLELFRERESAGEAQLPERGGRALAAWIRSLRAAGSGAAGDHRTAPVVPETLWRIAEDPAMDKLARAAAAIALSAGADTSRKPRLRRMADVTADPDLRGLLEATAEDADEEALSHALSRLTKE